MFGVRAVLVVLGVPGLPYVRMFGVLVVPCAPGVLYVGCACCALRA